LTGAPGFAAAPALLVSAATLREAPNPARTSRRVAFMAMTLTYVSSQKLPCSFGKFNENVLLEEQALGNEKFYREEIQENFLLRRG
jgi:hypothetical protein